MGKSITSGIQEILEDGVKALVIWPLGKEVKGLQGMTEVPIQ